MESTSSGKESGSPSDSEDDSKDQNDSIIAESVVQVDDGGSDLTDRFKYKVSVKWKSLVKNSTLYLPYDLCSHQIG